MNTSIPEDESRGWCILVPASIIVRCLISGKRNPYFPLTWLFLIFSTSTSSSFIYSIVWWSIILIQWFLGVCEMFQTSWGGGPSSIPPHPHMTLSLQLQMQLRRFDGFSPNHLQVPTSWMYHLDDPFLFSERFPVHMVFFGCYYISCTQILFIQSWLLSQVQYVLSPN